MDLQDLLTYGLGVLMAGVGFILKQLWSDIRETKEGAGKLKGKIELVEQKFDQGLESSQHVSNLKFKQLNEKLDTMCQDIKEDINELTGELKQYAQRPGRDDKGRFTKKED